MYLFEGLNGGWYYNLHVLSRIFASYGISNGIKRNLEKFINLEKSCLVLTGSDKPGWYGGCRRFIALLSVFM